MQKVGNLLRLLRFTAPSGSYYLLWTLVLTMLAATAGAQDLTATKINLDINGVSIKDALSVIQQQSGIKFIYGADVRHYASVKVSVKEKNISVKDAIARVLKNTNLRYIQKGAHVLIDEKPAASTSPDIVAGQQAAGSYTLKGRVVDFETSQPLIGATVKLAEKKCQRLPMRTGTILSTIFRQVITP